MFKLINKQLIAKDVKRLDITAPLVAEKFQPGQFIMLGVSEHDEKIPITIFDVDTYRGSIGLIIKEQCPSTKALGQLQINDTVASILGPLGNPATVKKVGTAAFVAVDMGITQILPVCRAFKQVGNKKVVGIISTKTRKETILEPQMRLACQKLFMVTEDGSYERKGNAVNFLNDYLGREKVDLVYAAGPMEVLQRIAQVTKEKGIKTLVQLNPVMLDGTGICGSCRVVVNGQVRLACVDGPEFDAHKVDFDDLKLRAMISEEEHRAAA